MPDISKEQFNDFLVGVKTSFDGAFNNGETTYSQIASIIPSAGAQNTYKWFGSIPKMRKWIGDRVLNEIGKYSYTIVNEDWENTIRVKRNDIADGETGQYGLLAKGLGDEARDFPEELVYGVLNAGFNSLAFDGQNFFDTDHPVMVDGEEKSVSNVQEPQGEGEPWFLLDTTKLVKPLIFQDREKPKFASLNTDDNTMTFMKNEYLFGANSRCNAGYSFWQLAFGSKAPLTAENLKAAHKAMKRFKNDEGKNLGIKPNILVVGNGNEDAAEELLKADKINNKYNTLKGKFQLLVSSHIE